MNISEITGLFGNGVKTFVTSDKVPEIVNNEKLVGSLLLSSYYGDANIIPYIIYSNGHVWRLDGSSYQNIINSNRKIDGSLSYISYLAHYTKSSYDSAVDILTRVNDTVNNATGDIRNKTNYINSLVRTAEETVSKLDRIDEDINNKVRNEVGAQLKQTTDKIDETVTKSQYAWYERTQTYTLIRNQLTDLWISYDGLRSFVNDSYSYTTSLITQTSASLKSEIHNSYTDAISYITQTADGIAATVEDKNKNLHSYIEQKAGSITAYVEDKNNSLHSYITQKANEIYANVSDINNQLGSFKEQTEKEILQGVYNAYSYASSYIDQTADKISFEVKDSYSKLHSYVIQTASEIKSEIYGADGISSKIQQKADEISERVDSIDGRVGELKISYDNLKAKVDNNGIQIDSVKTSIGNLGIDDIKSKLDSITSTINSSYSLTFTYANAINDVFSSSTNQDVTNDLGQTINYNKPNAISNVYIHIEGQLHNANISDFTDRFKGELWEIGNDTSNYLCPISIDNSGKFNFNETKQLSTNNTAVTTYYIRLKIYDVNTVVIYYDIPVTVNSGALIKLNQAIGSIKLKTAGNIDLTDAKVTIDGNNPQTIASAIKAVADGKLSEDGTNAIQKEIQEQLGQYNLSYLAYLDKLAYNTSVEQFGDTWKQVSSLGAHWTVNQNDTTYAEYLLQNAGSFISTSSSTWMGVESNITQLYENDTKIRNTITGIKTELNNINAYSDNFTFWGSKSTYTNIYDENTYTYTFAPKVGYISAQDGLVITKGKFYGDVEARSFKAVGDISGQFWTTVSGNSFNFYSKGFKESGQSADGRIAYFVSFYDSYNTQYKMQLVIWDGTQYKQINFDNWSYVTGTTQYIYANTYIVGSYTLYYPSIGNDGTYYTDTHFQNKANFTEYIDDGSSETLIRAKDYTNLFYVDYYEQSGMFNNKYDNYNPTDDRQIYPIYCPDQTSISVNNILPNSYIKIPIKVMRKVECDAGQFIDVHNDEDYYQCYPYKIKIRNYINFTLIHYSGIKRTERPGVGVIEGHDVTMFIRSNIISNSRLYGINGQYVLSYNTSFINTISQFELNNLFNNPSIKTGFRINTSDIYYQTLQSDNAVCVVWHNGKPTITTITKE